MMWWAVIIVLIIIVCWFLWARFVYRYNDKRIRTKILGNVAKHMNQNDAMKYYPDISGKLVWYSEYSVGAFIDYIPIDSKNTPTKKEELITFSVKDESSDNGVSMPGVIYL